jgi:hypothetical protein
MRSTSWTHGVPAPRFRASRGRQRALGDGRPAAAYGGLYSAPPPDLARHDRSNFRARPGGLGQQLGQMSQLRPAGRLLHGAAEGVGGGRAPEYFQEGACA